MDNQLITRGHGKERANTYIRSDRKTKREEKSASWEEKEKSRAEGPRARFAGTGRTRSFFIQVLGQLTQCQSGPDFLVILSMMIA